MRANQLEALIREYVALGWESYQIADVNIEVQPGCLSSLFGATTQYARYDQLIFRADENMILKTSLGTSVAGPESPDSHETSRTKRSYDPVVVNGGKILCWKCGKTNYPTQDRCWDCYSDLYNNEAGP